MKLIASLIVRDELGRYLEPCIAHLLGFCDEVRILDNGSTDLWEIELQGAFGEDGRRVRVLHDRAAADHGAAFFNHAAARQRLLEFTLEGSPTHILAIDADEFVADGKMLRRACEQSRIGAFGLCMQEVWNADMDGLQLRQDGGWVEHDVFMLWAPAQVTGKLQIIDKGPATGRTPDMVSRASRGYACTEVMHFGWTNRAERQERYQRYVIADGGRFHAKSHLDSILLPDEEIILLRREWPEELLPHREAILSHAGVSSATA